MRWCLISEDIAHSPSVCIYVCMFAWPLHIQESPQLRYGCYDLPLSVQDRFEGSALFMNEAY